MLVWFRFKNFASFKDEAILDMRAVKSYKEHPYNLIRQEKEDLLKVVSIYGANASGKSNFVIAFSCFRDLILNSFQANNKNESQGTFLQEKYFPFLLNDDSNEDGSEFEAVTREGDEEFQYGFVYNHARIEEEWLYRRNLISSRTTKIFERKRNTFIFGSSVKQTCEKYESAIDEDVLGLSFYSSLNIRNHVFAKTLKSIIDFVVFSSTENTEKRLLDRYFQYVYSDNEKEHLLSFLNSIDVGIADIQVEKNKQNQNYDVYFIHLDADGEQHRFHISLESAGTIKAISLYSVMRMAAVLNKGVIIDEFNTKLHPLLQKHLIDLFYDGTVSGQLIYTTHDTTLLDNKYMRRDQIWFTEKNKQGESSLYSLSDFKIRNDRSFEKDYLAGVYGAIPILKDYSFAED